MEKLKEKLSEYGDIIVCKDNYVFTLYMKIKTNKTDYFLEIFRTVLDEIKDKPYTEVIENDEEKLLIILKP